MPKNSSPDSYWIGGVNSLLHPAFLKPGQFQWGINVDNSGGFIQTRQGYSKIRGMEGYELHDPPLRPRGMTVFTPKDGVPTIVIAVGGKLLISRYPFRTAFQELTVSSELPQPSTLVTAPSNGVDLATATVINVTSTAAFPPTGTITVNVIGTGIVNVTYTGLTTTTFTGCSTGSTVAGSLGALATGQAVQAPILQAAQSFRDGPTPVVFVSAYRNAKTNDDGTLSIIDPYPVLIIQDGGGSAMVWAGTNLTASHNDADSTGIPIGLWGAWSGSRYWVSNGNILRASNLGDPLTFTEEKGVAQGGYFSFPADITGIGQTSDFKSLLVFTNSTTSTVQSGILAREQWAQTNDFQRVMFPSIGCVAGKSIINQYGMTWWYSNQGLMGLNQAIQIYRDSSMHQLDLEMARSKGNLSPDKSGICMGSFGNFLVLSVPSGDGDNAHTWVMNHNAGEQGQAQYGQSFSKGQWVGAWTGTRPVEWVTAVIKGESRCFFLSKDYGIGGTRSTFLGPVPNPAFYPNVWEGFIGDKVDVSGLQPKNITCSFETRGLAASEDLSRAEWAELELSEIVGNVSIQVYYAGLRSGYKKILDKTIVASPGSINGPLSVTATTTLSADLQIIPYQSPFAAVDIPVASTAGFPSSGVIYVGGMMLGYTGLGTSPTRFIGSLDCYGVKRTILAGTTVTNRLISYNPSGASDTLSSYRPQRRTIRTRTIQAAASGDNSSGPVESKRTDNLDRAFTLLVKWTGRMAITGLRLITESQKNYQDGACEDEEMSARYVTDDGAGAIVGNINQEQTYSTGRLTSTYVYPITPKHTEDFYSSFSPNDPPLA